jgi:hypothetical protein
VAYIECTVREESPSKADTWVPSDLVAFQVDEASLRGVSIAFGVEVRSASAMERTRTSRAASLSSMRSIFLSLPKKVDGQFKGQVASGRGTSHYCADTSTLCFGSGGFGGLFVVVRHTVFADRQLEHGDCLSHLTLSLSVKCVSSFGWLFAVCNTFLALQMSHCLMAAKISVHSFLSWGRHYGLTARVCNLFSSVSFSILEQ